MCFTIVSLVTSNIRGSSICSPKSLYKKTSQEILGELKAAFKTGESKVLRTRPVLPNLLWQACVNSQLSPTPPSPPRGREKKNVTKMNFSSCNDHSPKWIINEYYIFFPYLRVWVFLFLRISFFTAQHIGTMLHHYRSLWLWIVLSDLASILSMVTWDKLKKVFLNPCRTLEIVFISQVTSS